MELTDKLKSVRDKEAQDHERYLCECDAPTCHDHFVCGFDAALDPKVLIHHPMVRELVEIVEMLGNHHRECECWCMDHRGIVKAAYAPWKELLDDKT